ncbi:MAG TPA: FAD-binding oxidoreductase [Nitrososphaerales archaeon]|nr:FAD-binding oxidoreductase [Nitrososphaerales archaeon]
MRTAILGGGITGLFLAYYLRREGEPVTLIERDTVLKEASVYNAGLLTPSFAPTPQLGLGMLLSASLRRQGALYFSLGQVLRHPSWYWISLRRGLTGFEDRTIKFGEASLELYREFFKKENLNPDIVPGVLGLYAKAEDAKSFAEKYGGRFLGKKEIDDLGLMGLEGGVELPGEMSINPRKLVTLLYERVGEMGVEIVSGKEARLERENQRAVVSLEGKQVDFDKIVVTAGSWTRPLCAQLHFDAKILPASGFVMIFDTGGKTLVKRPMLLEDYGIALAQHSESMLRVTSFFEMVGFKKDYGPARRKWLFDMIKKHAVDLAGLKVLDEGIGFRPCTPDQFPLIGAIPGYDNAFMASGNCRLGVTLAPATAFTIKSILCGEAYLDELRPSFNPARFT